MCVCEQMSISDTINKTKKNIAAYICNMALLLWNNWGKCGVSKNGLEQTEKKKFLEDLLSNILSKEPEKRTLKTFCYLLVDLKYWVEFANAYARTCYFEMAFGVESIFVARSTYNLESIQYLNFKLVILSQKLAESLWKG